MAGASEGKGHHRKGLREENIPPGGPWRKEASQHLRSLVEKKSVPVVPVVPVFQYSN